jgi:curved DNA-binding protein CbpA
VPGWAPKGLREALQLLRLGWPPTDETLVTAWRQRALETHPDRGGDHKTFVAVQSAYEVVQEALKRGLPQAPSGSRDQDDDDGPGSHAAAYTRFRRGLRRSRKGNLWREWGNERTTVFRRQDGRFAWVVSDEDDEPRWSPWAGYSTEEAACRAAWGALR